MKFRIAAIQRLSIIGAAIAATLTVAAAPAIAAEGQAAIVKILELATTAGAESLVSIRVTPGPSVRGDCSTHVSWHFVLDLSTTYGKTTYPLLLEAFASGRSVTIYGTDLCHGNIEILRYFTGHT